MPLDPSKYLEGQKEQYSFDQLRRSERANAFNAYKNMKIAAGEPVDPLEMDRLRISMSGGDPYLSTLIPSGAALQEMVKNANEQSGLVRATRDVDMLKKNREKDEIVQGLVDENFDKSPEQMTQVFETSFGKDAAAQIYSQYKSQLPTMLNAATNKKIENIIKSDAMKYVKSEADLYRFMPVEMRDGKIAPLLKNYVAQTNQKQTSDDTASIMDAWSKIPESIRNSKEGVAMWKMLSSQAAGYQSPDQMPAQQKTTLESLANITYKQADNIKISKVLDFAGKSTAFLDAVRAGDEDNLYTIVEQMMIASGFEPPKGPQDPNYIKVRNSLDAVAQVSFISDFKKEKAKYVASAINDADAVEKAGKERMDWVAQSAFSDMAKYGVKNGDKTSADPRIQQALESIRTNTLFFPSDNNVKQAVDFIKQSYDQDPQSFDPAGVAENFMANVPLQSKNQWVESKAQNSVEGVYGIEPGKNFKTWASEKTSDISNSLDRSLQEFPSIPSVGRQQYIDQTKKLMQNLRATVDVSYNNPETRVSIGDFNPAIAEQMYQVIGQKLNQVEELHKKLSAKETPTYNFPTPQPQAQQQQSRAGEFFSDAYDSIKNIPWEKLDPTQKPQYDQRTDPRVRSDNFGINPVGYFFGNQAPTQTQSGTVSMEVNTTTGDTTQPFLVQRGAGEANTQEDGSSFERLAHAVSMVESSGNPNAKASTSSAAGLFQFTQGTWNGLVNKYGEEYGITEDMRMDPGAQRVMFALFSRDNAISIMRNTGKTPTDEDIYLAHFLGAGGASQVINNLGTGKLASQMFPRAAQANRSLFYDKGTPVTIDELYDKLGSKLRKHMK